MTKMPLHHIIVRGYKATIPDETLADVMGILSGLRVHPETKRTFQRAFNGRYAGWSKDPYTHGTSLFYDEFADIRPQIDSPFQTERDIVHASWTDFAKQYNILGDDLPSDAGETLRKWFGERSKRYPALAEAGKGATHVETIQGVRSREA